MASLKIILPCSSHRFPSSHFSFPSHVRLPHIIRWSDLLDRRILTRAASRAALQLRRTMNNDCGVYRWTCVSARAAVCWQRPGSYSSSILLGLQQTMKAAGTMNTKTLKGHRRHLNSLQSHCKRTDPNKKSSVWRNMCIRSWSQLVFLSFLPSHLRLSKLLQHCAPVPSAPLR